MKKISIIIPVYNVESYIRKCLDSVVNQSYTNLEIICINDGSTDLSGRICDEYANRDTRIRVIHQPNGGNSRAVNAGLDLMSGEYVGFVDPDDWLELNQYESLYQLIENFRADFVCSGWYKNSPGLQQITRNKEEVELVPVDREQMLTYTFIRDKYPAFGAYYWNKLFRADIFNPRNRDERQLRMAEDLKIGADVVMFVAYMLRSRNAVYTETPYYHYYQRETSVMHSRDIEKRKHVLTAYTRVIDILEGNSISTDLIKWVKRFYVYHASVVAEMAVEQKDRDNILQMQTEISRYLPEYLETNTEFPERIERIHKLLSLGIEN